MFDCLNRVDWNLLHRQKLVLLAMRRNENSNITEAETLDGIIELIDALQDDAVASDRWSFPEERTSKGGQ